MTTTRVDAIEVTSFEDLTSLALDPGAGAVGHGRVYCKVIGGVAQVFYQADDGTVYQITPPSQAPLVLAGSIVALVSPTRGFLCNAISPTPRPTSVTTVGAVAPGYVRQTTTTRMKVSWNITDNTGVAGDGIDLSVQKNGVNIPGWPLFIIPGTSLGVTNNFGGGFAVPLVAGDKIDVVVGLTTAAPGVLKTFQISVSLDFF